MLSYDKSKFTLVIAATEEQKKEALADFEKMNAKINSMFKYLDNKDTPVSEKEKFGQLAIEFMRTITATAQILRAMGIPEAEIRKHYKF